MAKKIGIRDAYGEFLVWAGERRPDLVVLDGDLSSSTRSGKFGDKFPERFFNMGVSEQDMIGTAAGLALGGLLPFVSSFAVFLTGKPYEQIRQTIALMNVNVKLVSSHAGLTVGPDGATHQFLEDLALMRVLPHMKVFVPADAIEARRIFEMLLEDIGPAYVRGARVNFPVIFDDAYRYRLGVAPTLVEGSDATIIACGVMVHQALDAATILRDEGIAARVVNMSTIKPIDVDAIVAAAHETGAIVTAEDHSIYGGLGSAVAEVLVEHEPVPMVRVGVRDMFGTSGEADEILRAYGLAPSDLAQHVRDILKRAKR